MKRVPTEAEIQLLRVALAASTRETRARLMRRELVREEMRERDLLPSGSQARAGVVSHTQRKCARCPATWPANAIVNSQRRLAAGRSSRGGCRVLYKEWTSS